jgi:hypothetical protein
MAETGKPGRKGIIGESIASELALATAVVVAITITQAHAFGQSVSWLVQVDRTLGHLQRARRGPLHDHSQVVDTFADGSTATTCVQISGDRLQ